MIRLTPQKLTELVAERGLKMTPQRRAIVECLAATRVHPTADEVFMDVNRRFPMTSRATVYNTLNLLIDAELVNIIEESGVKRFDPNLEPHHHFICSTCGMVEDVEATDRLETTMLNTGGHQVESMQITLRGTCALCFEVKND